MRRLSATPCPASNSGLEHKRRDSIFSVSNDTTANLDFTTEFKASFRDVKPRRPPVAVRKRAGNNPAWTIHEDEELNLEPKPAPATASSDHHQPNHIHKHSQSGRRVSFLQTATEDVEAAAKTSRPASSLSKAPRRLSINPQSLLRAAPGDDTLPVFPAPKMAKPRRRGTVYIPSDDTTMPTMFMDIFSPLRKPPPPGSEAQDGNAPEMTGLAMQMQRKKGPRKSILTASPKRGLLQPAINVQLATTVRDRAGKGPGKENIPPGTIGVIDKHKVKPSSQKNPNIEVSEELQCLRTSRDLSSRLFDSTASSNAHTHQRFLPKDTKPKPAWNSNFLLPKPRRKLQPTDQMVESIVIPPEDPASYQPVAPRRMLLPSVQPVALLECQFLPEGVVNASMYEEGWLSQQEIALTQLTNQLFNAASSISEDHYQDELQRIRIAEVYGRSDMAALYSKVQDSLSQGALGISQDVLNQGHQLYADLGRRKAYTGFWLANYNVEFLQRCLEVIVGRVIPSRTSGNRHGLDAKDTSRENQGIRHFIEKFLIRNEDVPGSRERNATTPALYRRTVLRSLMLVRLLDLVKSGDCVKSKANLFQTTSEVKSSADAVTKLAWMLNPTGGDPTRALRGIGYNVVCVQYPLEEYEYAVNNLAVDLRDGVRLARLVELLLYRSASQTMDQGRDLDATTTIVIPSGQEITLGDGHQDWPLSQHLKLPCLSRAAKLYNVQLALSALKEVKGMSSMLQDIEAADIVDGFREKTVKLLWGLNSKWGLGGLVDWKDVRSEIKRLGRSLGRVGHLYLEEFDCDDDDEGYLQYKSLLKAWVKAVAASRGLRVRNFTSDFADGRLFGALVSEYQPLLTSFGRDETSRNLSERLRGLGCSDEFGRLFTNGGQQIFDRDFVLASIAFLCSRLLGPTKRARAAVILQRAWRKRWGVVIERRKRVLRSIASDCAEEVRIRKAKACIWRAWCEYRTRRAHTFSTTAGTRAPMEDIWLSL